MIHLMKKNYLITNNIKGEYALNKDLLSHIFVYPNTTGRKDIYTKTDMIILILKS
jgi:hypothetical protein